MHRGRRGHFARTPIIGWAIIGWAIIGWAIVYIRKYCRLNQTKKLP